MGMSPHLYVGPFVKCKADKQKVTVPYTGCGNKQCVNYKKEFSSKFCPECGGVATKFEKTEKFDMDFYDLFEKAVKNGDAMSVFNHEEVKNGEYWLVPNRKPSKGMGRNTNYYPDEFSGMVLEINDLPLEHSLPTMEKAWLEKEFAREIIALEAVCAVTISWGIILQYS